MERWAWRRIAATVLAVKPTAVLAANALATAPAAGANPSCEHPSSAGANASFTGYDRQGSTPSSSIQGAAADIAHSNPVACITDGSFGGEVSDVSAWVGLTGVNAPNEIVQAGWIKQEGYSKPQYFWAAGDLGHSPIPQMIGDISDVNNANTDRFIIWRLPGAVSWDFYKNGTMFESCTCSSWNPAGIEAGGEDEFFASQVPGTSPPSGHVNFYNVSKYYNSAWYTQDVSGHLGSSNPHGATALGSGTGFFGIWDTRY